MSKNIVNGIVDYVAVIERKKVNKKRRKVEKNSHIGYRNAGLLF